MCSDETDVGAISPSEIAKRLAARKISGLQAYSGETHHAMMTAYPYIAEIAAGAKEPGKQTAGRVTRAQLREIAEMKMKDLNANDIEAAARIIEGSARAMGLEVTGS